LTTLPADAKHGCAMRVLFLEVDTEGEWSVASIGPAFIAAVLREHGHVARLLRVREDLSAPELVAQIQKIDPQLIGVSLTTRQWLRAWALIGAVRMELDVPVIAGGLHPTFSPQSVLRSPGFDYVCVGEGEYAMLELVEAIERGTPTDHIANIQVRGGSKPQIRPPIEPLDALPFMARDLLDEHHGVVHFTTQRGCPFPCTYCAARMYDQLYDDAGLVYGRRRSHDSVLSELHGLHDRGALSYVIFLDDTFTIHRPWVRDFCDRYGRELALPFSIHARVETVDERLLDTLATAGCRHIVYGVESGSYRVRREIMQRPVKNERIEHIVEATKAAGMMVTTNYMLGLPGETPADLDQTVALAERLDAYDFGYFVFYPYPGTPLFSVCRDAGYLPDDYLERPANHRQSILDLPDLTADDIAAAFDRFTALRERTYAGRQPAQATTVRARVRQEAGWA